MGKWENVKQKPFRQIWAYSRIFRDIQTYSDINQTYSGIFWNYTGIFSTLCNPGIFRTVVYSESWIFKTGRHIQNSVYPNLWHIQNQRHIQNPGLFRILGYSESRVNMKRSFI